jgi:hypothetical protein
MSYSEEQYDAFEKRMHETYPAMFANPYGGFAVGAGWWPVIESLCANIQSHINWKNREQEVVPQVVVAQIKEKFGGLRFYYEGGDDVVRGMVRMAEAWADASCEECGKPGTRRNGGWIRTLCDEHEAERQERMKKRFGDATDM